MRDVRKDLIIQSLPEDLNKLEQFIEEICDAYNINNTYFGNITVALTEAAQNAFIHGNKGDRKKEVNINFSQSSAGLVFRVADEGKGFDFNGIPDPLMQHSGEVVFPGRGVFLIRTLADSVKFEGTGNVVEIVFKISSINHELSIDRRKKFEAYSKSVKTVTN